MCTRCGCDFRMVVRCKKKNRAILVAHVRATTCFLRDLLRESAPRLDSRSRLLSNEIIQFTIKISLSLPKEKNDQPRGKRTPSLVRRTRSPNPKGAAKGEGRKKEEEEDARRKGGKATINADGQDIGSYTFNKEPSSHPTPVFNLSASARSP